MRTAKLTILALVLLALAGCGGGGGGDTGGGSADTMTVIVSGISTTTSTYTEGPYNAQGYLDPSLSSFATTSSTYVSLCSGVASSACATLVTISIKGAVPGSYPTGTVNSPTQITYKAGNQTYSSVYSSTIGTITLSGVGNAGDKITGSFDAIVALMTNTSDTLGLSGTFSVERDH